MKRLKQVSGSRRLIEEGLVRAVLAKRYAVVSVADIAAASGVSRTTFYRHFSTKRDVLLSFFRRISGEVLTEEEAPAVRELVRRRFAFIADHPELPALLADSEVQVVFHEFRRDLSTRIVTPTGDRPTAFAREFYLGGTDAVTSAWIRAGMIESVDEMTEIVVGLIGKP